MLKNSSTVTSLLFGRNVVPPSNVGPCTAKIGGKQACQKTHDVTANQGPGGHVLPDYTQITQPNKQIRPMNCSEYCDRTRHISFHEKEKEKTSGRQQQQHERQERQVSRESFTENGSESQSEIIRNLPNCIKTRNRRSTLDPIGRHHLYRENLESNLRSVTRP